ncbi:5'-3' exonuclease [Nakamurella leprariae]|uniref:5'-3' exonuclease n=1 Tax=Nakamurella leprariae TaxID=2803911 RepID=A0A938Y9X6_9ACTN|nr:5'-3' exonuclease [Nakamurella leprariae]MBM9465889.1 5'-3' exonuclease [Nakamurella leprariae]
MLQLLDLAGIYFRAFHATPTSITAPDGRPVNAVRGSLDIVRRVLLDARPTRMAACLDLDWRPQWRVDLLPSYKAHRVAEDPRPTEIQSLTVGSAHAGTVVEVVPDELSPQVPVLLDVLAAFGLTVAGAPDCEADDVIGTLAGAERRDPVEIVTGDRDLFQCARDVPTPVVVRYVGAGMSKAQVYTPASIAERYGIPAGHYADFAALRGDPSDGLPGVAGIGDKTAASLVRSYGDMAGILTAVDDPRSGLGAGPRSKLSAAADYLAVAPQVVAVRTDAPVSLAPDGDGTLPARPADPAALQELAELHGLGGSVARLIEALAELAGGR